MPDEDKMTQQSLEMFGIKLKEKIEVKDKVDIKKDTNALKDEEGDFILNGVLIHYSFKNNYFDGVPHLEFDGKPNLISNTGYKSHFWGIGKITGYSSVHELIKEMLIGWNIKVKPIFQDKNVLFDDYKPQTKWKVGERFLFDNGESCEYGTIDKIGRHIFADGKKDKEDLIEAHLDYAKKGKTDVYMGFFENDDNIKKIEQKDKCTTINVKFGLNRDGDKDYYISSPDLNVSCHSSGGTKGFPEGLTKENFDKKLKVDVEWIKHFLIDNGFKDKDIKIIYEEITEEEKKKIIEDKIKSDKEKEKYDEEEIKRLSDKLKQLLNKKYGFEVTIRVEKKQ